MRKIDLHIVHCADTPSHMDVGAYEIRKWHTEERGWSDIGYHYIIRRNGRLEEGRPLSIAGAHCRGKNRYSIGTCLVGGKELNGIKDFTDAQFETLERLHRHLLLSYNLEIFGHNDFDSHKTCPNFDVKAWWEVKEMARVMANKEIEVKPSIWQRFKSWFKGVFK